MKKSVFRLSLSLLCLLCALSLCTCALAADTSKANCTGRKLRHCDITELLSNRYTEGRPVIVFFPGSEECNSRQKAISFIRGYKLYDGLEVDLVSVTLHGENVWYRDWESAVRDLFEFLKEKYDVSPFPVIADAVSFGGYGGCYLAQYFTENGIPVQELNLADACGSYCIQADWIRRIAEAGTQVNLLACTGTSRMSRDTRAIIEAVEGTENCASMLLECRHGEVLGVAIHERGLHAAYASEEE